MSGDIEIVSSQRLSYRLLNADDADLLFALDQDPEVMRFISNGEVTPMEKIHNVFLPRLSSYTHPCKGWGMWGVFSLSENVFLGWILVRPMHFFSDNPEFENLELGWRFKRHAWGYGFATEAAKQIMQAIYRQTGIKHFSAIAVTENKASIKIMQKLGMTFVSSGVHKDPLGDMLVDTYALSLK